MSLLNANLKAFLAVAEAHTVQGAAKSIGLTPTGVTQRIRALENELNTTLFTRSRSGMRLTTEAESLLRYCQSALELEGSLFLNRKPSDTQVVRASLTGPTSLMSTRVATVVGTLSKKFPKLLLSLKINDIENRMSDLKKGLVQFAVVPIDQVGNELDSKRLKPEEYLLVGPMRFKGRPLASILQTERLIDFDSTDSASTTYLDHFNLLQQAQKERHFVNNNPSLIQMMKDGVGYGVLTREVAAHALKSGDLMLLNLGKIYKNSLALCWYPRTHAPDYFRAIIEAIH